MGDFGGWEEGEINGNRENGSEENVSCGWGMGTGRKKKIEGRLGTVGNFLYVGRDGGEKYICMT
jgi:hypothetical protein